MTKLKIVFIQRQFSHYRKAIFDELNKRYNIYLLHGGVDSSIVESEADYSIKIKYFKYWEKVTNVFLFVFNELLKIKPDIIVHEANPSILSMPLVYLYCLITNSKFVLWGHGYNRNQGFNSCSNIKSKIRLFFLKKSDAIILYDISTKNKLTNYFSKKKLFVAQNTIDTKRLLKLRDNLENKGKSIVKKELGFETDYNLIFIGRLLPEKKPFETLKLFETLKNKFNERTIGLHIIGDGPEFDKIYKYIKNNSLDSSVKLYGGIYNDNEIGKKMYASDILINPGYVGLNVNHAFCFNLPVFTFFQGKDGPFHSPEVEFIVDGQTGFFCKPFDYHEMVEKIVAYLISNELQDFMKTKIKFMADNIITIENMAKGFHECFAYLGSYEK